MYKEELKTNICLPPPGITQKKWLNFIAYSFQKRYGLPQNAFFLMQRAMTFLMVCTGALNVEEEGILSDGEPSKDIDLVLIRDVLRCILTGEVGDVSFVKEAMGEMRSAQTDMTMKSKIAKNFLSSGLRSDNLQDCLLALDSFLISCNGQDLKAKRQETAAGIVFKTMQKKEIRVHGEKEPYTCEDIFYGAPIYISKEMVRNFVERSTAEEAQKDPHTMAIRKLILYTGQAGNLKLSFFQNQIHKMAFPKSLSGEPEASENFNTKELFRECEETGLLQRDTNKFRPKDEPLVSLSPMGDLYQKAITEGPESEEEDEDEGTEV